ncbi:hypothetical protein D1007_44034 [Hordeum vulgare]|nr:hypothetical protein D1007_44034 [Hordeum vulgare]
MFHSEISKPKDESALTGMRFLGRKTHFWGRRHQGTPVGFLFFLPRTHWTKRGTDADGDGRCKGAPFLELSTPACSGGRAPSSGQQGDHCRAQRRAHFRPWRTAARVLSQPHHGLLQMYLGKGMDTRELGKGSNGQGETIGAWGCRNFAAAWWWRLCQRQAGRAAPVKLASQGEV